MFLNRLQQNLTSVKFYETPFGTFTMKVSPKGLTYFRPKVTEDLDQDGLDSNKHTIQRVIQWLDDYFQKVWRPIDFSLDASCSQLSKNIYQKMYEIPVGRTVSYKELANVLGHKGSRGVGNVCSKNDIMIIIPCHRVIGSDGSLTGFFGGKEMKRDLLMHEQL